MSVVLNEAAIRGFFNAPAGPMARLIGRKAHEIEAHARNNVEPHHRSGNLEAELGVRGPFEDSGSFFMLVGSSARHPWKGHAEGFAYPTEGLEVGVPGRSNAYPWLLPAVRASGFSEG